MSAAVQAVAALGLVYWVVAAAWFIVSAFDALGGHASYSDRQRAARLALSAHIWPLVLSRAGFAGVRKMRALAKEPR